MYVRLHISLLGGGKGDAVSGGAWHKEGVRAQGTMQGARSVAPCGRHRRDDGEERARDVALVRPCAYEVTSACLLDGQQDGGDGVRPACASASAGRLGAAWSQCAEIACFLHHCI